MSKLAAPVRVLVVDDDPSVCVYLERFLVQDGLEVGTLTDAGQAAEAVRSGGYHLVVLDLHMPGAGGIEVLRELRKVDADVAVILLTGYPSFETAVEALKLQASDYLSKPVEGSILRDSILKVMRDKGLARAPEEELHRVMGDQVRNRRKAVGLTLKQMGRRTGLSVSLLSQIERAESSASISSLYKIAVALDMRMHDLFGEF